MACLRQSQAGDVIDDPEAYAVYASVLPARFSSGDNDLIRVALLEETRSKVTCPREEAIAPAWRQVWENYKQQNARVRSLRPDVDIGVPYVLISLTDIKGLLARAGYDGKTLRGGWSEAYTSFPNGKVLALSVVGFDEAKSRAIVTVQYNCGTSRDPRSLEYDCHGGRHVALVKQEDRWVRATDGPACGWVV